MGERAVAASGGWGLLPLRVVVGLVFAMHGGQKLFVVGAAGVAGFLGQVGVPAPGLAAWVVIAVEFLGGILLLLGLLTRPVALLLAADMLGAILFVHGRAGFFLPRGYEFVLTLLAASLTLLWSGPGAASVDGARARRA